MDKNLKLGNKKAGNVCVTWHWGVSTCVCLGLVSFGHTVNPLGPHIALLFTIVGMVMNFEAVISACCYILSRTCCLYVHWFCLC